jgi:hypothetical protein
LGAFLFIAMRENPAVNAFKVWIFPSLASAIALLIWNDVNEIKSDVKQLMAQSNVDKTRIDNLERVVYKTAASFPTNIPATPVILDHVAILPEKLMIKQIKNEKVLL